VCYNEEKLLPFFFQHYEPFVDRFYMYDNYSKDGTRQLIRNHPKAELINLFTWGKFSEKALTKSRNSGWKKSKGKADFVIVCDVDELLYHTDLEQLIADFKKENISLVKTRGVQMVSRDFPSSNESLIDQIKTGYVDERFSKTVMFDPNVIQEMNFDYGSHESNPTGQLKWSDETVDLLHYSFVGVEEKWDRISQHTKRYGRSNKEFQLGVHYTWSKERLLQEFDELLDKSTIVI
jgi:hypothetical protein